MPAAARAPGDYADAQPAPLLVDGRRNIFAMMPVSPGAEGSLMPGGQNARQNAGGQPKMMDVIAAN